MGDSRGHAYDWSRGVVYAATLPPSHKERTNGVRREGTPFDTGYRGSEAKLTGYLQDAVVTRASDDAK
jgi:hypothetical protein